MAHQDADDYSKKHQSGQALNPAIAQAVKDKTEGGNISCATVFFVCEKMSITPAAAGKTVDLLQIKLSYCQLGLFGYPPARSIIIPADSVSSELESAIQDKLSDGHLSCAMVWKIAEDLSLKKMDVSEAAEALKIKMKPCQLGAF